MSQTQFKNYLKDRVAIVAGGCGGIGAAICERFANEGATVYAADIAPGSNPLSAGVTYLWHDVTSEESAVDLMNHIDQKHGELHVLVNAAGIEFEKTIEETSLDEWNQMFAINVTGTFLTSKYALPLMRKAASKGAIHGLTKAMACDHGPENIRVNAICPGYVDTPMLQSFFGSEGNIKTLQKAVRDVHPLRTYGQPEDVANLVNWLAGDEARYASGQLWVLDGGLTAQVQQMKL